MSTNEDIVMSDDEVLDYTQLQRRKFIRHFTSNGEQLPTDPKDAKVLLTALSDMDRTALGKKRIKSDEEIAKMNAQSVDAIAAEVRRTMGDRYRADPNGETRPAPTVDESTLPPLETLEGEMAIGDTSETHEAFQERYERVHGKPQRRAE